MATFNKFDSFVEALAEGTHDLGSDNLYLALTNTAPSSSDTQLTDITEISAGNGYTAGGSAVTITASSQTGGTYSLVGNDVTFTASGGAIATFRYVVLYNDSATNDELIGYYDNGTTVDLSAGQSFTVDFGSSILTIA